MSELKKITIDGVEYDLPSGGGEGTTVIPNPEGTPTAKLEKIQIEETIFNIEGGTTDVDWNDISGKPEFANVAISGSYDDLINKPTIPDAVTESTVSEWGFTKNTGTYIKPDDGIPKSDLNQSVQDSLDKAETALQSFTETDPTVPAHVKSITETDISNWNDKAETSDIPNVPDWALEETKPTYTASEVGALPEDTVIPEQLTEADILDMGFTKNTGTYIKPESGIPKSDLSEEVRDSLDKAETDPTVPAHVKSITETDILNWNDKQDKLTAGDNITIEDGVISAAGGSAPDNVVLHGPSEEEVEVPPIDADKLGGELPEYYENDLYLANESTPSTPSPRDADMLGGIAASEYVKKNDTDIFANKSEVNAINTRINQLTAQDGLKFKFVTDGEGNYGYLGADDSFIPFKSGFDNYESIINQAFFDAENVPAIRGGTINIDHDGIMICNIYGTTGGSSITLLIQLSKDGEKIEPFAKKDVSSRNENDTYIVSVNKGDVFDYTIMINGTGDGAYRKNSGISAILLY